MAFARPAVEEAQLGMTPLIDVVLLLLIFFLVTTTFAQPELAVKLPEASHAEAGTGESLLVEIDREGAVIIDGATTDPDSIGPALRAAAPEAVELRADREVPHHKVVDVLDAARGAGIDRVGIAVAGPGAATEEER